MSQRRGPGACAAAFLLLVTSTACVREFREQSLPTGVDSQTPATPAPKAEPTPLVVATPLPTPTPAPTPGATSCPPLLGIRITVFATQPQKDRVVLDATPLTDQCAAFPGRLVCPLGPEGSTARGQCETARIGAEGPLWMLENGRGAVEALPGSGYLAAVVGKGLVTACSRVEPGVCANIDVR